MSDVKIHCRPNGPLLIEGSVTIVDHLGNAFTPNPGKPKIALCRCSQSKNKPFCDGAHNASGFSAQETATVAEPPAEDPR